MAQLSYELQDVYSEGELVMNLLQECMNRLENVWEKDEYFLNYFETMLVSDEESLEEPDGTKVYEARGNKMLDKWRAELKRCGAALKSCSKSLENI